MESMIFSVGNCFIPSLFHVFEWDFELESAKGSILLHSKFPLLHSGDQILMLLLLLLLIQIVVVVEK